MMATIPSPDDPLRDDLLAEVEALRGLTAKGIRVAAQDVPTARPVPLGEFT